MKSPRLQFLKSHNEQDLFDNLINVPRDGYVPTVTSDRVHRSLARTRILRGGLGGSKTRTACEHINNLCLHYPGSLHFIGRRDITSLKVTTQKEYLEKVVSPETIITFNINDNILYYKNGSQVLFRETKEPDKVKSLELTSYMLDEADENPTDEIQRRLNERLRQQIMIDGKKVVPPYVGLLVFNPVDENHWLYDLAHRGVNADEASEKDPVVYQGVQDVEDFRFSTYENERNLPPNYIVDLRNSLPDWDLDRLIDGHWGRSVRGRPVIHGFSEKHNVRSLTVLEHLPLLVGWDFGYNHPALSFSQFDPLYGRYFKLREFQGNEMHLPEVAENFKQIKNQLVGVNGIVIHYGDPHGLDVRDIGEGSVEYLRIHHKIFVNTKRSRIKTGLEEIQSKVLMSQPLNTKELDHKERLFLIDRSCKISIKAYLGSYHRDEEGNPVKDGYFDHLPDTDRYIIVNTMGAHLARNRAPKKFKYSNKYTGY